MPLDLLRPPALVRVRDRDGSLRSALLIGRRDDRSYVQVSRGPGDNVLRWLPSTDVGAPGSAVLDDVQVDERTHCAPVQLRTPRSWR